MYSVSKDFRKCLQCTKDPCTCKSRNYFLSKPMMTTIRTAKREHKSHVPSACTNCKLSHLACDLSRPCKRCITLNKINTCQDTLQKKRGRPKQQETELRGSNKNNYEILFGTIQTPAIATTTHAPPASKQISDCINLNISFIHEPLESFSTIKKQRPKSFLPGHTINLILSMDACCARASNDTLNSWGYHPYELLHRSMYDFISPQDTDKLSTLLRHLLQDASRQQCISTEKTPSPLFSNTDLVTLCTQANGANTFSDTIDIKKRAGDYERYDILCYIGVGLGADLSSASNLSKQYIVVQFKKHTPTATFVNTIFSEGEPTAATFVNTIFTEGEPVTTITSREATPPPLPPPQTSPILLHPPVKQQTKPQQHIEMSIRSLLC